MLGGNCGTAAKLFSYSRQADSHMATTLLVGLHS